MFNSKKPRKALSQLEHLVMDVVWPHGSATAEQVREALAPTRPLKDSTIRTVLRRLEEKGYLQHRAEGRTYVYTSVEPPQAVAAGAVRQIIDRFCGGSMEQLLLGLVNNDVVDEDELQRLAQRIARRKKREPEN
jgi:BlaI family penicillinase repressor